ncbi:MAG: nucleotidyltransferase family protein [Desulfosudaceae bacterium]
MTTLSHITAVILAGGQGNRLRQILPDTPKALADIRGRPFISFLLNRLEHFGFERVVLCTGYLGNRIEEALGNRHGHLRLIYSQDPAPLGTGGALAHARPSLPADRPVLVLNGDSYCHADLRQFYARFPEDPARAAMLLTHLPDTRRYGRVELDPAGRITAFHEKNSDKRPGWINAGVYLLDAAVVAAIPAKRPCSLEKEIFPGLAGNGGNLAGFPTRDEFIDIGTNEDYQNAPAFFANLDKKSDKKL